jgi:hypothetical protein
MALESLAVSMQIRRPAIDKLPFILGVSDPPLYFPWSFQGLLDCTLTNSLFLLGGVSAC